MHRKYLFIVCVAVLCSLHAMPQSINAPLGARAAGMGHCSLLSKDVWASFNNQAALAYHTGFSFGVSLKNAYLLKEINRVSIATALQLGRGGFTASVDHFGNTLYSEMKAGAGYALRLGSRIAAGLQIDYLRMAIGEGFGSYHAFTFEGGMLLQLSAKLSLGFHCFNPIHSGWAGSDERIPVSMRAGFGYQPEKSISICAEIMKSTNMPAIIAVGCEYRYRERFFMRAGISSGPARICFGTGIKMNRINIDISTELHSYLGVSPQFSISYNSKP